MVKYLFVAFCLLVGSVFAHAATLLQQPTAWQINPSFVSLCMRDHAGTIAVATGVENGNLVGYASVQGYICMLKVHSGRGPGDRIFSACGEVVWDMGGNIISVEPTISEPTYSIACQ